MTSWTVPVILGSIKDKSHSDIIVSFFSKFNRIYKTNIDVNVRACSAHKNSAYLRKIISAYEDYVPCFVTIAGKSNALSAVVDAMTVKPVLSCPPISTKSNNIHDIFSSLSLPSGVAPMTVLNYENCCLAVVKIIGLLDADVSRGMIHYQSSLREKIRIEDLKTVAVYSKENLDNSERVNEEELYKNLKLLRKGKVRDIYADDSGRDILVMKATNRLSSFDRYVCDVPYKGEMLNRISIWWFNQTRDIVPNHFIQYHGRDGMVVHKCEPIMVEFVVRSYMTGSTKTSIWKNYERGMREYCGHTIRDGYKRNEPLDETIVTPTTKGETDELIDADGIVSSGLMSREDWEYCEKTALKLFKLGQQVADHFGMILVDTKYEFGRAPDGSIMLIDEVHTPDSSRYWVKHSYLERMSMGEEPENIDKDIIRKWIKKEYDDPYSMEGGSFGVSDELINLVSLRYIQLYKIITDKAL